VIAELAARQHGLVTLDQLRGGGAARSAIRYRIEKGSLLPIHRGVYQVGPVASPRSAERAALLASGRTAALSHRSAGALLGIAPPVPVGAWVDVTIEGEIRRRRAGIREHRTKRFAPGDVLEVEGLRVTAPIRTILDLASVVTPLELEQALARADRDGLVSRADLEARTVGQGSRRGMATLRALLEEPVGPALTRSAAEERFLALVRKARLPFPEANVTLGRYEVDFLWRREKVVVEVDGFAHHASKASFERDRARDAEISACGIQVVRVTWRQIVDEPEVLLVRLAQTLAIRRHQPVLG
jgi:very-short-patch-repair endonuclease